MLKRVDVAAYDVFDTARQGEWKPGVKVLGLRENGVGWALDDHNAPLITPAMQSAAEEATRQILAGEIAVHDYIADGDCPAG